MREIETEQTIYDLIFNSNKDNMFASAIDEKTHHGSTDGVAGNYIGYIYKKYTLKNTDLITNKFIEI